MLFCNVSSAKPCAVRASRQAFAECVQSANMWPRVGALVLLVLLVAHWAVALHRMHIEHSWGVVDFVFQSPEHRQRLLSDGTFVPGHATPFDVDVDSASGRVFLSIPSLLPGSPVSLATVLDRQLESPRLAPYPDWSWHAGTRGCLGIGSVFRIHVDECRRLWVADCGVSRLLGTEQRRCPPQLLVFDLASDRLLRRHQLPTDSRSLLTNVVTEAPGGGCGDDVYAFVADSGAFRLLVYSLKDDKSWEVYSKLFFPDVNRRVVRVDGEAFEMLHGLMGLALSPALRHGDRLLFFHAFNSVQEGVVHTAVLRNQSNFSGGNVLVPEAFRFIGHRHSQAAAEDMSMDGVMFFSEWSLYSIKCWNSRNPYSEQFFGVVEHDEGVVRAVTGMKLIRPYAEGEQQLWVLANNAHRFFTGSFRPNASNAVRIMRARHDALLTGSVCAL